MVLCTLKVKVKQTQMCRQVGLAQDSEAEMVKDICEITLKKDTITRGHTHQSVVFKVCQD